MNQISLAIVEDDKGIREAMEGYFNRDKTLFSEVLVFGSVEEILASPVNMNRFTILLDINLPGMSGIEGIPYLKQKFTDLEIVMISVLTDTENIFNAICAGASGYLDKDTSLSKIKDAIVNVHEGGSAITPAIARKVFDYFKPSRSINEKLTQREEEVVKGIVDGLSYKLIADRLNISINTIRKYIQVIYRKLEINSKGELISKYHQPGSN